MSLADHLRKTCAVLDTQIIPSASNIPKDGDGKHMCPCVHGSDSSHFRACGAGPSHSLLCGKGRDSSWKARWVMPNAALEGQSQESLQPVFFARHGQAGMAVLTARQLIATTSSPA